MTRSAVVTDMSQLIVLVLIGVVFYCVWRRGPSAANSTLFIRIRQGQMVVERGHLSPDSRHRIAEIIRDEQIERGEIAVSQQRRVTLSRQIPLQCHQLLRNIVLTDG